MSMIIFDIVTQLILITALFLVGMGVGIMIVTNKRKDTLR